MGDDGTDGRIGLQPGFGIDDSKDFYQLLFFYFFSRATLLGQRNDHALRWQLKGRENPGQATLIIAQTTPVDIKREKQKKGTLVPLQLQEMNQTLATLRLSSPFLLDVPLGSPLVGAGFGRPATFVGKQPGNMLPSSFFLLRRVSRSRADDKLCTRV